MSIQIKNDNVLISDINSLQQTIGGGALATSAQTLIGAINEIHDGYLPLTGGTITGCLTILGIASDHMLKTRGIWGINPDGTDGDLYIGYNGGTAHSYVTHFGYGGEGSISADGKTYSGTSARATSDGNGNNIINTYLTKTPASSSASAVTVGTRKDGSWTLYKKGNLVFFRCRLIKGGTNGTVGIAIPAGYRPAWELRIPWVGEASGTSINSYGYILINTSGTITFYSVNTNDTEICMDTVWWTEQ